PQSGESSRKSLKSRSWPRMCRYSSVSMTTATSSPCLVTNWGPSVCTDLGSALKHCLTSCTCQCMVPRSLVLSRQSRPQRGAREAEGKRGSCPRSGGEECLGAENPLRRGGVAATRVRSRYVVHHGSQHYPERAVRPDVARDGHPDAGERRRRLRRRRPARVVP